jgi:hypothetical protein
MFLRQNYLVVGFTLCLLIVIPGCKTEIKRPGGQAMSIQITAPDVACLQNGQTGVIDVPKDTGACWTGPQAGVSVQVQLPANCPFSQCSFPTTSGSMCSGPANDSVGTTYVYTSITINGNPCAVGTDGLRIRP